ncbi:MAG TPA: protein kinase [Pirellulales bacterium]|nr:protein kinase [Pirellulales bacterium]
MESPELAGRGEDVDLDLRIAEILEKWEARRNGGETPDLLELAEGDAALAEKLREYTEVMQAIDATGFASLSERPVEAVLVEADLPAVSDFAVLKELGRGGMGVVYEAHQISLDRVVALKLLPLGTVDRSAGQRFLREAATAASLQHPNIVPIYATGQAPGTLWYAMQRIDGESLAQLIARHPSGIGWQRVVEIGIIAAEALAYAHWQGIVHRDIKPANLLQDAQGHVWLTDFGLARRDVDATLSLSQALMGTPRYMSPEQIAGASETVDHRTDLYGLGVTLYELATGQSVVRGTSPLEVLEKIRQEEPVAPRAINPKLPRALEVVLLKCLEKSPRDRYATAADLLSDLKALRDGRPIAARGLPTWTVWSRRFSRHASRVRLAALAATVAIAVVSVASLAYQQYTARRRAQLQMTSAGGPFVAAIRRAPSNQSSAEEVVSVALPMQQPLPLEAGEYEIAIAAQGRFGERARLPLNPGDVASPRYVDRRPAPPALDVDRMWISEIHSDGEPRTTFLFTLDNRQLSVYADGGRECFRLELMQPAENNLRGEVGGGKVVPALRGGGVVAEGDRQLRHGVSELRLDEITTTAELFRNVDFSYRIDAGFTGMRHARRPYLAKPQRFMPVAADLNGDGEADFVLAARLEPIVAALDHRGNLLWVSRAEAALPPDAPPPWIGNDQKPVELPSILQMALTHDHTGDGVRDVLVVSMAVRPPQSVYPQITLLSGRDGERAWTTPLPPISAANGSRWPLSGVLEYQSREVDEYRYIRPLLPSSGPNMVRNVITQDRRIQWIALPFGRLPVTPSIELFDDGDEQAIVLTAAKEVRRLDVATGRLRGPMALCAAAAELVTSPRTLRMGANQSPGVLVQSCVPTIGAFGAFAGEQLAVFRSESQTPLWSRSLELKTDVASVGREKSDFPFVVDLDHDGIDDMLVAVGDGGLQASKEIRRLDAATGDDGWEAPLRARCAESLPERICLVGDVDADGVDDVAIASLYGETQRDRAQSIRSQRAEVSVYIDVVSGRSGQRLKVLHSIIAEVDKFTRLMEIDSLRAVPDGAVEASIVWGEPPERRLDGTTVRFSLERDELPLAAHGLTALARLSPSGAGYYLQRPGPNEIGRESAAWIDVESNQLLVFGYQWVLESWHNARGEPRVLLTDRDMSRIAAVDVPSGRLLWRQAIAGGSTLPLARHLRLSDQDWLLVQTSDQIRMRSRWTCLDAETGRVGATLANQSLGGFHDADACEGGSQEVFVLSGAPGRVPFTTSFPGFSLRKIALGTAKTVWEKSLLGGLSPRMHAEHPVKLLVADVDGDGISDCIVPDGGAGGDTVRLVAISGRDGRELWSCPTELKISEWPRNTALPLMELAPCHDDHSCLLLVDRRGANQLVVRLLQLATGQELDARTYPTQLRNLVYTASEPGMLSLQVHPAGEAAPIVSLVVPQIDAAFNLAIKCSRLELRDERLHERVSTTYKSENQALQVYTSAADTGGSLARIVLTGGSLTCYRGNPDAVAWRKTRPPAAGRQSLIATADPKYMIWRSDASDTLLDVSTGRTVYGVPRVELNDRPEFVAEGPTLLIEGATPHLVQQQRDGVRFVSPGSTATGEVSPSATATPAPLSASAAHDPRHWRAPVFSPLNNSDRTLTNLVANMTRAGVQSLFAFVLPLAGVHWLIRKRRFSLAQLSLAPLAALACVMTWRTMLAGNESGGDSAQEPWFVVLFTGTMVVIAAAFVVRCVVERRVWPLFLALALAAGVTAALQWIPALLAADDVRYRLGWDDFLAGMFMALIVMLPQLYLTWRLVQFLAKRIRPRGTHA